MAITFSVPDYRELVTCGACKCLTAVLVDCDQFGRVCPLCADELDAEEEN